MRVLICGDRKWTNWDSIVSRIADLPAGTIIIEGEARGADQIARKIAEDLGYEVERYPANWEKYGRAAGPIRNTQMLEEGKPDLVVAFHSNIMASKGTANMVEQAQKAGIPTEVISA